MPNYITHNFFAQDIFKELPVQEKQYIETNQALYNVGSNGPDLFYFHGLNAFFIKESKVRDLGHLVHQKNINDFYTLALNLCIKETNTIKKKQMKIYLCGHVTHWALDAYCHPYIYYRCHKGTLFSSQCHHRLEALIDTCFLESRKLVYNDELNKEDLSIISDIYTSISKNIYQLDISKQDIEKSYYDWKKYRKKQKTAISTYPIDPINENHHVWHHPCDNSIHTESFMDLYNQAKIEAIQAIHSILNEDIEPLLNQLQDCNYYKGRKNTIPMKYFSKKKPITQ